DGKQLAAALSGYGQKAAFWVGDLSGRGHVVTTGPVVGPVWAPDGRALAYEPGDNEIDVIAPSGKPRWRVLGDANFAAWSRLGRLRRGGEEAVGASAAVRGLPLPARRFERRQRAGDHVLRGGKRTGDAERRHAGRRGRARAPKRSELR